MFLRFFPNYLVHTSLVAGSFANFLYFVIDLPVTGCVIVAQTCSNSVVVSCMGIYIVFISSCVMKLGIG